MSCCAISLCAKLKSKILPRLLMVCMISYVCIRQCYAGMCEHSIWRLTFSVLLGFIGTVVTGATCEAGNADFFRSTLFHLFLLRGLWSFGKGFSVLPCSHFCCICSRVHHHLAVFCLWDVFFVLWGTPYSINLVFSYIHTMVLVHNIRQAHGEKQSFVTCYIPCPVVVIAFLKFGLMNSFLASSV